ncbi:type II 3-dehydroquinate dehydratase [candidate division KSB1 bacterium]|nr:type II 3-dehydroquinate dehydratase [candidate division KSB1 bacterium]
MHKILIIHGPNLNLLGEREPDIYGRLTLDDVNQRITELAAEKKIKIKIIQSNHEGRLIDFLHENRKWADGIVINPGAFTHYSYALRDAITGIQLPAVEVHLSDIYKREDFRKISVTKEVCIQQISGKGLNSYIEGLQYLLNYLNGNV